MHAGVGRVQAEAGSWPRQERGGQADVDFPAIMLRPVQNFMEVPQIQFFDVGVVPQIQFAVHCEQRQIPR